MTWLRRHRDSLLKALTVGLFALFLTTGLARAAEGAAPSPTDPFSAFVAFLKASGPLGVAVLAGWWAYKKDREKNKQAEKYEAQMKAMFDQVVGIVGAQTGANVKMESTIAALKDAIVRLSNAVRPADRDRDVGG